MGVSLHEDDLMADLGSLKGRADATNPTTDYEYALVSVCHGWSSRKAVRLGITRSIHCGF